MYSSKADGGEFLVSFSLVGSDCYLEVPLILFGGLGEAGLPGWTVVGFFGFSEWEVWEEWTMCGQV